MSIGAGGRRPFRIPGAKPHYAPDLLARLEHLALDVAVDPKRKTLEGTVTQRLRIVAPGIRRFKLDQVGLEIREARIDGKKAAWSVEGNALFVEPASSPKPDATVEVAIRYRAVNPRRGIYFTGPDEHYPKKPYQVWSQGQDEDTRYWIPTFDYPNQKATTEIIATVPKGFTAVANGALVERKGNRFHYRLGTPHVTYLISLVVAELSEWADKGPGGLPVQYFVAPGREADGKRAFGHTPKMIEAFSRKIGVPYPYEKYSQVAVQDFIFGGMENTSATTQTDKVLHDQRAHLDFSGDPLVSHELAHQWFGDLLTCRDWSHGWLNEGFATFMERVWIENNPDEYGGPAQAADEAKYYQYVDLKDHLEEDSRKYRRPIVCNTYVEPIDLFDAHLYQKGGLVLNLIRHVLGEKPFWKAINLYVTRHRGGSVETLDLIRAIEDATGRNLRRLFDEWVYSAGFPEFELSYSWSPDKKLAELVIEQKQTGGKPEKVEDGVVTPVFHLPVVVELTFAGGKKESHCIEIGELRERVFLPAPTKPLMVRFDPGFNIPKTMKFPRPKEMLLYQLAKDPDCMGRIEAAEELAKVADAEAVAELGQRLLKDGFWAVQAAIAGALAEIRTPAAREALVAGLVVKHPKARKAVVTALGTFRDEAAAKALRRHAEKDPSYFVEAEATAAWGRSRSRPELQASAKEVAETEKFLHSQLRKDSFHDVIRVSALRALAELPGIGRGERPEALGALLEWTRPGQPEDARVGAIEALGRVARTAVPGVRARILEVFSDLADEDRFRLRMRLVAALGASEAPEAGGVLEKVRQLEIDGRVRRSAWITREALAVAGTTPESVAALQGQLEKMEEEQRKLKAAIEEMRAR
jgi:aminopeptidase N